MNKIYWVLFMKDLEFDRQWGVEFGSYSLNEVKYECRCYQSADDYRNCKFCIIGTSGEQKDIDAAARRLNFSVEHN